jgi:hypothetical protein
MLGSSSEGDFKFMWRFVARMKPFVPGLVGARARQFLLASGAAAIVTLVALGAHALKPDESALKAGVNDPEGGETVVSKDARSSTAASIADGFEPTSVSRLVTMALAPVLPQTGPPSQESTKPDAEPNLLGLSEIPKELIWNRPLDKKKRKAFAAFSGASENLPWDAVEPVPFSPLGPAGRTVGTKAARDGPVATPRAAVVLPSGGEVKRWVKSKVTEIKGSARSRPLYHFELWLEPPEEVKRRLVGVSYAFSTPAVRPQSQASSDKGSGFRISAGGLACADEITLTLRFDDGLAHTVALDGCKLLS